MQSEQTKPKNGSGSPFIVTLTPDARNKPPKRLLKIWLPSNVAVAWFVISIPFLGWEQRKAKKVGIVSCAYLYLISCEGWFCVFFLS